MKLELRAIPQSPLHLSDRHGAGNHADTLHYLPGTAVRGAMAAIYLNRADLQQRVAKRLESLGWSFADYFRWLFLSEQVRFPNLYPHRNSPSFVIPLSALSCKRFTGFVDETGIAEPHGIVDALLNESSDLRCSANPRRKPICGAPMEPIQGFYESSDGRVHGARRVSVGRRVLARTAVENATEVVRPGMLYSLEALEEAGGDYPIFSGVLLADAPATMTSEHQADLIELLGEELRRDGLANLHLGAARTRGLGSVQIEIPYVEVATLPPLEDRFERLQEVWRQVRSTETAQTVFTLTLNADAIVLDILWRYRSLLDVQTLAREVPGMSPCHLRRCFTQTRIVSGWNSAHRLPKEDELAIIKGAAFLYTTTADRETVLTWLHQVEEDGIGERRSEGFGRIIVCHPFHWEVPPT